MSSSFCILKTKDDLLKYLRVDDSWWKGTKFPQEEILRWFQILDAGWTHSGDPKDPHAELTSGYCSNGFFDCLRVLRYVNLSRFLAKLLAQKIHETAQRDRVDPRVKWVIGSPMAAITFAHDVADFLRAPVNMFLEKDPENKKRLIWNRMEIPAGERVLQIEELITTAHTTNEVVRALQEGNRDPVTFFPYIGALVHRPPKMIAEYGGRKVVALIEKEIWAVPPSECPLCAAGSERVRPKQNWNKLTGKC